MGVNKKSISAQALMEMKDIKKAIKEESKETLKAMLSEAVKDVLRESIEGDDDMEIFDGDKEMDDDKCCEKCGKCGDECKCEKKDAERKEKPKSKKESGDLEEDGQDDELAAQEDPNAAGAGMDQMAQMGQMDPNAQGAEGMDAAMNAPAQGDGTQEDDLAAQDGTGDEDTIDLTREQDIQNVLRVYKALPKNAQIVVTKMKNDNGSEMLNLSDNETGAEYIIDLGTGEAEAEPMGMEDGEAEQLSEEYFGGASDKYNELAEEDNDLNEPEMKDNEVLFEIDLGYTDNYQDKDPIDGLSNSEPSKSGRSWHKGIPTGTEKPWAGKGTEKKGDPFDNTVNENLTELDDDYFAAGLNDTGVAEVETEDGMPFDKKVGNVDENVRTAVKNRTTAKSLQPKTRKENGNFQNGRHNSTAGEGYEEMNEAIKKLKAKNKKLNEAVAELHKGLQEAYMTNVNLGKITKLFLENVTTQAEKLNIVERFSNEAKTPKQAQALYESISSQLEKAGANKAQMTESKTTEKSVVNEGKAYKSQDLLNTIDLMNRVINL